MHTPPKARPPHGAPGTRCLLSLVLLVTTTGLSACGGDDAAATPDAASTMPATDGATAVAEASDARVDGDGSPRIDSATPEAGDAGVDAAIDAPPPCDASTGMALEFEGTTPDLVQATIATLPLGRSSRTIELWAWFDGTDLSWVNEHGVFEYGNRNGDSTYPGQGCHEFGVNSIAWPMGTAEGQLHPYGNCPSVDNFFPLPANTPRIGWLHISLAYDGQANHFQFTINGVKMVNGTSHQDASWMADPSWASTASPLSIGTTPEFAGPTGWQGKIDEFRVWSVFRSEAEIAHDMKTILKGNEPGLVAYYKFDEGSGTTIADATGDATHVATMIGPTQPQWVPSDIPGPFGCAP
jgi:hypothetical protein